MKKSENQKKIEIYTKSYCGYCHHAKTTLKRHQLNFTEISLDGKPDVEASIKQKTSWPTVPIILIDDHCIGGYTELTEKIQAHHLEEAFFTPTHSDN